LGSTGRSFVVGFGENPPKRPITELLTVHGRTVRWSLPNTGMFFMVPLWEDLTARTTTPTTSVITPAMKLPVTIMQVLWDCLQKCTSFMAEVPIPKFNGIEEVPEDEIFVEAGVNASGNNFIEIKAIVNNKSGWPARVCENLSFRYLSTLKRL